MPIPKAAGATPQVAGGILFPGPEPGRFLQYRVNMESRDPEKSPLFRDLSIEYSTEDIAASSARGRVEPNRVPMGVDTTFVYTLDMEIGAGDQGVKSVQIAVPGQAQLGPDIDLGNTVLAEWFSTQHLLTLIFAEPLRQSTQLQIPFRTRSYAHLHRFRAFLFSLGSENPLNAAPNQDEDPRTQRPHSWTLVTTTVTGQVLEQVRANPPIFSPNGDGVNDATVIELVLSRVDVARPVSMRIFDLSGRTVARLRPPALSAGTYLRLPGRERESPGYWDGRDDRGNLVPPGSLPLSAQGRARCRGSGPQRPCGCGLLAMRGLPIIRSCLRTHLGPCGAAQGRVLRHSRESGNPRGNGCTQGPTFGVFRPLLRLVALLCVIAWERAEGQLTTTEYLPYRQAQSRFLNREYYPWWHERYENYSLLSYRDYTARPERPTYDPFGAYLLDGVELLRVEEYRTLAPQRSSRIFRSGNLAATFRNLVIMRDHYRDWSARVMVGDALEARFTPLTLDKARLQGLRWDGSSYKNRFTVLGARVSSPLVGGDNNLPFATYLFGGRWESRLGNVLTVGGSYVNLHLRDSMQRRGSTRGTFPTDLAKTTAYYVVFSDDSPEDDSGVQVLAVEIFVDGAPLPIEPDIRRIPRLADPDHVPHLRRHGSWAPQSVPRDRVFDSPAQQPTPGTRPLFSAGFARCSSGVSPRSGRH